MSARSKAVARSDSTENVTVDDSIWVKEVHIHDHDGCYDLLHCVGGKDIGKYKRKMFNEGNYLISKLECKAN